MPSWIKKHWAALAVAAIVVATAVIIRLEGRIWFCACQQIRFIIAQAWSPHTSQHLLDPYSITHIQHGLALYWLLVWLAPRTTWQGRLVAATAAEALWEIVENSPIVIQRYRDQTAALGYEGDSVVNAVGDILACIVGIAIAGKLGWRGSVALFIAVEAGLLVWIHDSLLLNVVMLFYNVDWLKEWQMNRQRALA